VSRRQIWVMVDGDRILPEPPRRLDADEDVTEAEPRDYELPTVHVQLARRRPPMLLDTFAQILGQPSEKNRVAPRIQPPDRPPSCSSVRNSRSCPPR
jgi:hypothetical protein